MTALPFEDRRTLAARLLQVLQATDARSLFIAGALFLLVAIPPSGILVSSEEQYLAVALRSVDPLSWPEQSNLLGGFPHAFVFNEVFGRLVSAIGFSPTQVLGRLLAIGLYSLAFARLFSCLRLSVLDLSIVISTFMLVGQSLVGDEWMFRGIEPKVPAYGLVLLALVEYLRKRTATCFAMLAAATYIHAFVGAYSGAILFIGFMLQTDCRRRAILSAGVAALFVLPYGLFLLHAGYSQFEAILDSDGPTTGWILSYVAFPWHTAPFVDLKSIVRWTPGLLLTAGIAVAGIYLVRRHRSDTAARMAELVIISSAWVLAALVLTYLFPNGELGPFLLFRPSSLNLLLALVLFMYCLRLPILRAGSGFRLGLAVAIVPMFAHLALHSQWYQIGRDLLRQANQRELIEWIGTNTAPDSLFLLEPALDDQFFDFERRTHRATAFVHLFPPGRGADIHEWYERYLFRQQVMENGCPTEKHLPVDYLLLASHTARRLSGTCGEAIHESGGYSIVAFGRAKR